MPPTHTPCWTWCLLPWWFFPVLPASTSPAKSFYHCLWSHDHKATLPENHPWLTCILLAFPMLLHQFLHPTLGIFGQVIIIPSLRQSNEGQWGTKMILDPFNSLRIEILCPVLCSPRDLQTLFWAATNKQRPGSAGVGSKAGVQAQDSS